MENLIEVYGLCKRYKGFALENVDLTVPAPFSPIRPTMVPAGRTGRGRPPPSSPFCT